MRYELSDYEWSCDQVRHGVICPRTMDLIPLATIASFAGDRQVSVIGS